MGTTTENGTDLFGLRVLVVEDQFLQADALRVELQVWGIEVVGPAPTVEQAMALLDREPPVDAALLDINLHERTVYPLASLLQERRIPFAFVTGMAKPALPERYRSVPLWSKPHDRWSIPRRMAELLQPPPRGPWRLRER
jgi:CheY-like chemotaxis protein